MAEFHPVCKLTEIAEGESRVFNVNQQMVGIFNLAGVIYAIDDQCPHAGASLAHGIVEENTVTCRIHHWKFRFTDGKHLDEDNPDCNVNTFAVRIQDGIIQVEL